MTAEGTCDRGSSQLGPAGQSSDRDVHTCSLQKAAAQVVLRRPGAAGKRCWENARMGLHGSYFRATDAPECFPSERPRASRPRPTRCT